MTAALELRGNEKVLEVGTGSGYQSAILSQLAPQGRVYTVERVAVLASSAEERLRSMGYDNVTVTIAGAALGLPEGAPYDAIIVTAASPSLPPPLLAQMSLGGRLVIPIGNLTDQELVKVIRTDEGHVVKMLGPCRFVPLIGRDAWSEDSGKAST